MGYVPERGEIIVSPSLPTEIVPVGGGNNDDIRWGALNNLFDGGWRKTATETNYMSFFGTLAYSLKNRYVFNFNVRSDASNRFGEDQNKRFDPTWSAGFSWKVAEEPFIKENVEWLEAMNLRATYGVQGYVVSTISPELIATYEGILRGYNEYYLSISSLPNPHLKWEQTKTWNFGLDLSLFGVSMNVEYYGRRTSAISRTDVAQEYGMSSLLLNGGILTNHGFEVTLNFTPYKRDDFAWTIGLTSARNWNRSKLDDRTAKADAVNHTDFLSGNSSRPLKKGKPLAAFWSFSFDGLDPGERLSRFSIISIIMPRKHTVLKTWTRSRFWFTRVLLNRYSMEDSTLAFVGKVCRLVQILRLPLEQRNVYQTLILRFHKEKSQAPSVISPKH